MCQFANHNYHKLHRRISVFCNGHVGISSTILQENHLIEKPFPPLIHRDDGGALDDIEDKRAFYL